MRPLVRILIVTDDGPANGGFLQWSSQPMPDAVGTNSREFHLGEFVRVLQDTQWVGFNVEITRAHRAEPGGGLSEAVLKADRGADVVGFRFNQPFDVNGESRTLANYDMVLFFPISIGNADPALQPEADAIAAFMEGGGGFFATGDHANLGGQLAPLIPRVRSMRRWYFNASPSVESPPGPAGEPPAPPPLGYYRHDTTRKGQDNIGQFEDQSDEIPQVIAPAQYSAGLTVRQGFVALKYLPHPLLCSPDGVVKYLPDHMHEGTCEVPDNLAGRTFTLEGATLREYPDYLPPNPPQGYAAGPLSPEIVATGFVLPNTTSPALDPAHTGASDVAQVTSFGVIGAWDGHRVSKGRVVVDSTWHHFFNINLTGDRYLEDDNLGAAHEQKLHGFYVPDGMGGRVANDEYKMIQWYYRNIVYWLIPANRSQTIWWQILHDISRRAQLREELGGIAHAHDFKNFRFEHYLYFGQLAQTYLAQARGSCANYVIHLILYKPKIPWWEWIQEFVDVWDPARQLRDKSRSDEVARERLLGAWGAGPQPETGIALSLGAAIIAAAFTSRQFHEGDDASKVAEAAQKLFPSVLNHALKEFGIQLKRGMEVQRKLENVIADHLVANPSETQ
jgi:hypothetical protein